MLSCYRKRDILDPIFKTTDELSCDPLVVDHVFQCLDDCFVQGRGRKRHFDQLVQFGMFHVKFSFSVGSGCAAGQDPHNGRVKTGAQPRAFQS